jgi:23S rRNA pseudouridine2605 synthase
MRLNRFLAAAGFGSRRACDQLIASGAVTINRHTVEKLATTVAEGDDVRVNGRIARAARVVSLIVNKPRGLIVSKADERGRDTVFDFLPKEYANLFHVGRLDKESEGLLILTNDGDLAQLLTHPAHGVEKEYDVTLDKPFRDEDAAKMLKGIFIEGGRARFESLRALAPNRLKVVLRQGIKRQIRLMFYDRGYEVERLVRVRIGPIREPEMRAGMYRELQPDEVAGLRESAKKKPPVRKAPEKKRVRAVLD